MADIKFSQQQIEKFNDRIKNCIEDEHCRTILEQYLKNTARKPMLFNTLNLWMAANSTTTFDDDKFFDLIERVDRFNTDPLLTMSECELKLSHVKSECCRILEKIHPNFIDYLKKHHV